MNKRDFMMAGGSALVTGGSWAAPSSPVASSTAPGDMAGWQALVGQAFDVKGLPQGGQLTLQAVRQLDSLQADNAPDQFSLVFVQTAGPALPAGTQLLRASAGPVLPVFMANAGRDAQGRALHRADFCQLA